jgi:hypothetical protein
MLSFSTEFPVKNVPAASFSATVKLWISGSPHTLIGVEQLESLPDTGHARVGTDGEFLESLCVDLDHEQLAAYRHTKLDGDIEWKTEVVFSACAGDCWVAVRTNRDAAQPQLSLPPAKKPYLVKKLIESLGGGLDGELYVAGTPHRLASNDIGMTTRLLNGDSDNYLPVAYLSLPFGNQESVDADALARHLGGLAHVLVEPSRDFSRQLQANTSSGNVYGGAVGVYWPSGDHYRYWLSNDCPTEFDLRKVLIGRLRASLVNRRPLSRCTWSRVEAELARTTISSLRSIGSGDVDAYVKAFDVEISDKNRRLADAEAEIATLSSRLKLSESKKSASIFTNITEQEFFEGEFHGFLREELIRSSQNVQDNSRRLHILSAMVDAIAETDHLSQRRERLKSVLRKYQSMGTAERRELEDLGFIISEDGKHFKLTYNDDDRYTYSLPKSGSDHRGGLNAESDIGKRVF